MIRAIIYIFEKFGGAGFGLINLILLIFVSWKFATNHLKHLADAIDKVDKKIDNVYKKEEELSKDVTSVKERVSTLEGQLN